MNLFQGANSAATFLILSALVAGLAKTLGAAQQDPFQYLFGHPEFLYLGLFILIFRVKTFLDDHRHFAEPVQDKTAFRYAGFILAIISWFFWGLAAYLLSTPEWASELMAASLLVSTMWIAVHVVEIFVDPERRNTEAFTAVIREKWVFLNCGYILCLIAYVGAFHPVIDAGDPKPLVALLALLLLDILTSRSFRGIIKTA